MKITQVELLHTSHSYLLFGKGIWGFVCHHLWAENCILGDKETVHILQVNYTTDIK